MTKQYSAASLVRHYRAAKAWEPGTAFVQLDWATTLTAEEWLDWFRACLHRKITAVDPRTITPGPRWEGLESDGWKIQDYTMRRIRHSGCRNFLQSRPMQRRFPWINNQEEA